MINCKYIATGHYALIKDGHLYRSDSIKDQSYLENYPQLSTKRFFQDVILLDGRDFENQVDLFVGGSPCQSFSSVGFTYPVNSFAYPLRSFFAVVGEERNVIFWNL